MIASFNSYLRVELAKFAPAMFLVGALALFVPNAAVADNTIINFDDLSSGTVVTTQYFYQGVTLQGFLPSGPIVLAFAGAPSSPNVLYIGYGNDEFPASQFTGTFTDPHHSSVSMAITVSQFENPVATLVIYDAGGNPIGQPTQFAPLGGGLFLTLAAASDQPNIASFKVTVSGGNAEVDDLSFDQVTTPSLPDFALQAPTTPVALRPGGSASFPITIKRLDGSTGPISLQFTNLATTLVTGSISPNPSDGPDGATATVTLTAAANANGESFTLDILGSPDASSAGGYGSHAVSIPVQILDPYDAQILGLEITQGIQPYDLNYPIFSGLREVNYSGVPLGAHGKTVVRVFADFNTAPAASALPFMLCSLYGYSQTGAPLPGSPLQAPQSGNFDYHAEGVSTVTDALRADSSFTAFVLPDSWTTGTISVKAVINAASVFGGNPNFDTNPANDTFELGDISFTPMKDVTMAPVDLEINIPGFSVPVPRFVFEETRNLLPLGASQFHVGDYVAYIDITDLYYKNFSPKTNDPSDLRRGSAVLSRLRDMASDADYGTSGKYVVGVFPEAADANQMIRPEEDMSNSPLPFVSLVTPAAIVSPLGLIADVPHEFGHLLGRVHASGANNAGSGGQVAESWPPDQMGYIQGVGFDRRDFSVHFPGDTFHDPTTMLAPIYDFMSYELNCGGTNGWISVKGWNEEVTALAAGPGGSTAMASPSSRLASSIFTPSAGQTTPGTSLLQVMGSIDSTDGEVTITKAAPCLMAITPPAISDYHLQVFDQRGKILSDTLMNVEGGHGFESDVVYFLNAQVQVPVPFDQIQRIAITLRGKTMAHRNRSPHAPEIKNLSVDPDKVVGKVGAPESTETEIRWTATDADRDPLMAKVDFSPDGGVTWKIVYFGPNQNEVTLPSSVFSLAGSALVRVRINDGFNETSLVSKQFVEQGAPPLARLIDPAEGTSISSAASLYLSGVAQDDTGAALSGNSLVWYSGKTALGTGNSISITGLPVGPATITLTATDSHGRSSSEPVQVTITP